MKLIGSLTSPYVRKVRIVLAEKKLDYHLEVEDVWGNDRILGSNPLGKVPCLVMEGGEAVFDSRVIVEYVDTLSPVGKLIPAEPAAGPKKKPGLAGKIASAALLRVATRSVPGAIVVTARRVEEKSAPAPGRQHRRRTGALKGR